MSATQVENTVKDTKETQILEKSAEKVTAQSSTSATDKESSSKRKGTHIWAAKDPWSGNPSEKVPKDKKPKNSSAKNEKPEKFKKPLNDQEKFKKPVNDYNRYQPKLMLEEDLEKKTALIKIGRHTSIRQIIQYALEKIKNDWEITLNAFQLEMTKALQATEIIKTRLSFLHQLNKLISHSMSYDAKEDDDDNEKAPQAPRIRSGISITLSRNQLELEDLAGYQKPKPRQFLQPPPGQKKRAEEREMRDEMGPAHLKKMRNGKTVNPRPRFSSSEMKEETNVKPRKRSEEKKAQRPKQSEKNKGKRDDSNRSGSVYEKVSEGRYHPSRQSDRYDPYEDFEYRYEHFKPRYNDRRGPAQKAFESDFDHEPKRYGNKEQRGYDHESKGYATKEKRGYDHESKGYVTKEKRSYDLEPKYEPKGYENKERRGYENRPPHDDHRRTPVDYMRSQKGFRDPHEMPYNKPRQGPPPNSYQNQGPRGDYRPRGGDPRGDHRPRGGDPRHKDFDRNDRPGFFAGNRDFRADKIRNQPLEKGTIGFKNDDFEMEKRERMQKREQKQYHENRDMRDNRNRPQTQK